MNIIKEYIKTLKEDIKNKKTYKHIPNLLTFIRFLSPFFIIPLFILNKYKYSLVFVIIATITDIFDGMIARKYNTVSEFGRLLDAVTDKFFALSLLIPTIKINKIYTLLIIMEILIALSNYIAHKKNKHPKTQYIGKVKTVIEFIFIALCYLSFTIKIDIRIINIVFIINIILELITLIIYLKKNKVS